MKALNRIPLLTPFVCVLMSPISHAPAQSCLPPPAGLVAWWRGEGDATDAAGTNNGTLLNGATFATGEVGQAFSLDGIDDYIEVPNAPELNPTSAITVEAWYKPTVSFYGSGNDPIVDKGYVSHSPPYYQYHLGVTGDQYGTADRASFGFSMGGVGGVWTPPDSWSVGQWYHVVGTYDGNAVKLYVNGVFIASAPASGSMTDYGKNLRIGRYSNYNSNLPGLVDEVSLYNRALSASEIAALYAVGSAGKCFGPAPTNAPPTILAQPQSQTNVVGSTVTFAVAATGTDPLTYQWLSNSLPLADGGRVTGVFSNQLTIAGLQVSDSGSYSVVVSNAFGFAVSSNALLVVTPNLTWAGAVSSDWNNPGNWNPPLVPGAGSHVAINSGSVTIPANATFAVMDWTGGIISGALTVASNAVINISGNAEKDLFGSLSNAGTVVWAGGGSLSLAHYAPDGMIYNLAGGLFDIQNDQPLQAQYGGAFSNAGTVRKSAGSGTTRIYAFFDNTGTVEADTGTLYLGNGKLSGFFTAAPSATINFDGSYTLISGAPASTGAVQFTASSRIAFSSPVTNFNFKTGTLVGTTLVSGSFDWTGGTIAGGLTVASNAVLSLTGDAEKDLFGSLSNAGTVVWADGGSLSLAHYAPDGMIYNLAGGLFDIQNDQPLQAQYGGAFSNAGTVRKSAGSGTTRIYAFFDNTGSVEAQSGTVVFVGNYSMESSANLAVSLGGPAPGSGYGQIQFSHPVTFGGSFTVSTRNGYRPNPGDAFSVLSYPSATNAFLCLSGLDLGGGLLLQAQFSDTGLSLVTTTYTPGGDPRLVFTPAPNGLLVQWPLGFHDWDLQSTTNLASLIWTLVPTQCGNQALVPTVLPKQYFRLAKRTQPVISDPVGNLTGDTNRTYMDIVAVTMRTEGTNYVADVQMAGAFPSAADMAGGKRFDTIWFVDIDRNRATGQYPTGNDYNIQIALNGTGWHHFWYKVDAVSLADGITVLNSAFNITVVGNRATLTFPQSYLPSRSFEMWAGCFSGNAPSWTPLTVNPNTARATFNF